MIPVIETTQFRRAPVARLYDHILHDGPEVRAQISHLAMLADTYLEAGAPAIAGEKLLEAGLLARAHARCATLHFMRAAHAAMEGAHDES